VVRPRLREARRQLGYTQGQLASMLGFRSKSHYCMIENGQRGLSVETALRLSEILQRPVDELFDATDVHEKRTGEQIATSELSA
jgi:transcriptional regulator with XRE-family HTH domain